MPKLKLKPCKRCGCDYDISEETDENWQYYISCDKCFYETEAYPRKREAYKEWNTPLTAEEQKEIDDWYKSSCPHGYVKIYK